MIENKYTIEYVNPDPVKNPNSGAQKPILSFIFSGLLLAALLYFLLTLIPTNTDSSKTKSIISSTEVATKENDEIAKPLTKEVVVPSPVVVTTAIPEPTLKVKAPEPVIQKTEEVSITKAETKPKDAETDTNEQRNKQIAQNIEIEKSLALIKKQLIDSQKKNKELASELDAQIMENMELSTLLEDSLYKINKEDKSYINELKKLETNTIKEEATLIKPKEVDREKTVEPKIEISEKTNTKSLEQKTLPKKANQVDLSTTSQVDAIVAAMQGNTPNTSEKATIKNKSNSSASKVDLQDNINNLINDTKSEQEQTYQESLNKI